ncbi:hypothetical protein GH5_07461 [Leishmania sp. Ghana 2012 LV757]|uniref:hypothetical protein n=1 Tax=Leishmania sp. Ghana 2012 LV757 TaxID=2803181 RepID=UPI001B475C09|nr:hypothetical protein GH5_07461 [Leishmania sp. Ghana 2012 LV757]
MKDSRDYILRVWSLAEDMAVQSSKPLQAFLLLHHVLTQPPPVLRRASETTAEKPSISSSGHAASTTVLPTATTSQAVLPLHSTAFDAEWKCEELVTRLRAAEYLLFADVPSMRTAASSTRTTSSASPSPRTLGCTAGLEALELAEQVLAPVFATTSLLVATDTVSGAAPLPSYQQTSSTVSSLSERRCAANGSERRGGRGGGSRSASGPLEDVLREVADVSQSAAAAAARTSSASLSTDVGGIGAPAQSRVASMYFLNQATVTALTWPLSSFTLDWPMLDASLNRAGASHGPNGGEQSLLSAPLAFGPASETITVSVSLVVRAHVLQALICHRRAQHKRALQCLAEARQWIAQQYTDAARARTVRLLWEDLQERWKPPTLQQQQSSDSSSSPSVAATSLAQLSSLPAFKPLIERLITEEGRACAVMVQVEECKVHYAILQACGSLPPPSLLPSPLTSSRAAASCFADASAQLQAHTSDLRLNHRRYQESLQHLHLLSRAYMTVVRWIEEEAEGDAMRATAAPAQLPSGDLDTPAQGMAWREALRYVRSRLSPFCLCALQNTGNHATPASSLGVATATTTTKPTVAASPRYALGFDVRLAAEVLGWYHCISYVYLLYQQPAAASAVQPISAMHHDALSVVGLMARGTAGGGCGAQRPRDGAAKEDGGLDCRSGSQKGGTFEEAEEEVAFLQRYRSDPAYATVFGDRQIRSPGPQTFSSFGAALDTDDADVRAITCDVVHRAMEHAKINAFLFGQWRSGGAAVCAACSASAAVTANVEGEKRRKTESTNNDESGDAHDEGAGLPAARLLSWRAPTDATASTAPGVAHEAALWWCLIELGLRDNCPFAIRFHREQCNALSSLSVSSRAIDATQPSAKDVAEDVRAPAQMPDESAAGRFGVGRSSPKPCHNNDASSPAIRKRSRSPSLTPLAHEAPAKRTSHLQPPPSWSWAFPGVRRALQLYVELSTVLMRAAAITHSGASTLATGTEEPRSGAAFSAVAASATAPPIPIIRLGLHNAEQLMARLLFTVDAEMLQLTGNTWGIPSAAGVREGGSTRVRSITDYRNGKEKSDSGSDVGESQPRRQFLLADQLQCAAPVQLRGLVQIKAAALVTMARHHLTQLSLVRAAHYLREGQQFAGVFHRQAKIALIPEMHVLLACLATCMSLRRLPELPELPKPTEGKGRHSEGRGNSVSSGDGDAAASAALGSTQDALYAFAQGWLSAERATSSISTSNDDGVVPHEPHSLGGHHIGHGTGAAAFAILPQEERTVAQDVGLPYLHLLAAERATCTTLHTPPSLSILIYILKAWTLFHLVTAGEELVWPDVDFSFSSPLVTSLRSPTPSLQQQQWAHKTNRSPLMPVAGPRPLALKSPSTSPQFPPLPSPSHATTTLNSTVEDQQRRVARLDSLTTTPTSTPTLRSRHATLPTEMHRIHLEPAIVSAATARAAVQVVKDEDDDDEGCGVGLSAKGGGYVNAKEAISGYANGTVTHRSPSGGSGSIDKSTVAKAESDINGKHTQCIYANVRSASSAAAATPSPSGAYVRALPHTQKHRAGDVLQRMVGVLLDHYEMHSAHAAPTTATASSTTTGVERIAPQRAPAAAWTPQNVVLFRLLRGAVLFSEDKDEPAAARELKGAAHFAKQHLGVLHPYVADGLALLASAYASLDVDAVPSGASHSHGEASDSATSPSPQQTMDGAARTRKVAVQLAMRCSCMALASLYTASAANGNDSFDAAGTTTAQPQQEQTAPFSTIGARLREWWGSQVLHGLCGSSSSSGTGGCNAFAAQQLRLLFGWLPGTVGYCFP